MTPTPRFSAGTIFKATHTMEERFEPFDIDMNVVDDWDAVEADPCWRVHDLAGDQGFWHGQVWSTGALRFMNWPIWRVETR